MPAPARAAANGRTSSQPRRTSCPVPCALPSKLPRVALVVDGRGAAAGACLVDAATTYGPRAPAGLAPLSGPPDLRLAQSTTSKPIERAVPATCAIAP